MTIAIPIGMSARLIDKHIDYLVGLGRECSVKPVVADQGESAWQKEAHRDQNTDDRLKYQRNKLAYRYLKVLCKQPYKEIHYAERDLSRKHKIIAHRVQCYRNGKKPSAVVVYELLHAYQQQREQHNYLVELIKKRVIYLKSAECIKQCTYHGILFVFDEPLQINMRRHCRTDIFDYIDRPHEIRCPRRREQAHKPKERAAEHIIRIAADKI